MNTPRRRARPAYWVCMIALTAACGGDDTTAPPAPTTGAITVSVTTTGPNPDTDGYTAAVDGGTAVAIPPGQSSVTISDVASGPHSVALGGLGAGCSPTPASPQPVNVTAGATTTVAFAVSCGTQPGTTGRIVFQSDRFQGDELFIVPASGGPAGVATASPGFNASPTLSPDGSRIAFYSNRDNPTSVTGDIYVMNVGGTDVRRLTTDLAENRAPAWSPNSDSIVFVSSRDGNAEIYVMSAADGSGLRNLTNSPAGEFFPSWSVTNQILFDSDRDGNRNLYVVSADGTGLQRLTSDAAFDVAADWSPDGLSVAFTSDRDGNLEIYRMNAAPDAPAVRLTDNPATDQLPSWSPDGSGIAFTTDRDGNDEVYITNAADGSGSRNLTNDPASDEGADWGP